MSDLSAKRRVLLIGWDAADWEHITPMLEQGLLPTLNTLIDEGVMGNLATLQPVLSPMLWNSIATGKHAYKHGIHGFIEPDPHHGGARPYTSHSRTARALWNIFTHEGLRSNVINWWASHPAEPINGSIVTNAFGGAKFDPSKRTFTSPKGTVHPADKSDFYSQFKVFPNELTGEHLVPFAPNAAKLNQEEDSRLATLSRIIAETATTQAVATAVMESEPWDFMAVYFTGIDHFSHAFMHYHPPKMRNVPEADFEIFKDVIVGAYRFHDMMLERMIKLAGPDTTIVLCSDHGFQSRAQRPLAIPREPTGPAAWHRRFGVFVAKGPGIKQDERVYGASLVDIAPTILTMYGLPIGDDMDGRPLVEIFEKPPQIKRIPSWEDVPGEFGEHDDEQPMGQEEAQELLQQFAALGYIDDPTGSKEEQAASADYEAKYNLAANLHWQNMPEKAIPLMEELVKNRPWESRFVLRLAICYQAAGFSKQAARVIEAGYDVDKTDETHAKLCWAKAKLDLGEVDAAEPVLLQLEKRTVRQPGLLNSIGDLYLKRGLWEDAERVYRKSATTHEDSAEAHLGLSTVFRRRGKNQETIDEALEAVSQVYRLPMAHLNLGIALARSGDAERAVTALETAVKFGPRMANAHRWLAVVYRTMLGDPEKADQHQREFRKARAKIGAGGNGDTSERKAALARRHAEFDIPPLPTETERAELIKKERPDHIDPRKRSGKTFVLVSGLPRSGTSLMMQMLDIGGLPPKTDGQREADVDNPKGYYEWEEIKRVAKDPAILNEEGLSGKAIKVISMLLEQMPYNHDYKIVFMTRPIEEVVASQSKMIDRLNTEGANMDPEQIQRGLATHRVQVLNWIKRNSRAQYIEVDYPTLIASPDESIQRIAEFLGPELLPHPEQMRSVIDASLYRRRKKAEAGEAATAE